MKIKVLIVEDEYPVALDLQLQLENLGFQVVGVSANYQQAIQSLAELDYDIVLLDINLEEKKNGIDIGILISEKFFRPLIFTTAYSDDQTFAEALKANPMGYITKPIKNDDLYRNITIALHRFKEQNVANYSNNTINKDNDIVFIKDKGVLKRLDCKEILWIKAMDNYSIIHSSKCKYVVNTFLKDLVEKLGDRFIRIHRSHAVAVDKITSCQDNIIVINDTSLIVSNFYKNKLKDRLRIL